MSDPVNVKGGIRPVTVSLKSGGTSTVTVNNTVISILEMEDVLFHHDSAVMMPEKPEGTSSSDGTEDDATNPDDQATQQNQEQASGINALALVFKQSEFNPDRGVLIAGHTDTSGGYALNYTLAEQRAQNVLFLLLGGDPRETDEEVEEGDAWAEVSAQRHKIEDYQQILTHFVQRGDLSPACDPISISDSWNSDTESACNAFFDERVPDNAEELKRQVRSDPRHKWPEEAWKAVYNLYMGQLRSTLNVNVDQLRTKREALASKFSAEDPYVACGESFPIENAQQNNYRSQKNRRVEILFVDPELLENIDCPTATNRRHRTRLDPPPIECPLWHPFSNPEYIDPNDLYAERYYLQFKYYNRIRDSVENVPEGLSLQAFKNDGTQFPTETTFSNGTYCVKVQFPEGEQNPASNEWYLRFSTANRWVHTPDTSTDPQLVTRPVADVLALPPAERIQYYDLPAEWYSRNYWTRYDGSMDNGERWHEVINNVKNLAPAGTERLSTSDSLMFSLDDLVLLDRRQGSGGVTQNVLDANHLAVTANQLDAAVDEVPAAPTAGNNFLALGVASRLKILTVNATDGNLELIRTDPSVLNSCRIPFPINLVIDTRQEMRRASIVFFRDGFYTVGHRRTGVEANWENLNFVIGARAALRNDTQYHRRWNMSTFDEEFAPGPGDYDLHYFHHLYFHDNRPISYLIKYVSISFIRDTRTTTAAGALNAPPWSPGVTNFIDQGVYLAMNRWNQKPIYFENRDTAVDSTRVDTICFFDERETFRVNDTGHPSGIEFQNEPLVFTDLRRLWEHAEFVRARRNARGGKSKFLAFICNNERAWCWHIRGDTRFTPPSRYSFFKLDDDNWHGTGTESEDGETNQGFFVFPHEIGHAMGLYDEYNIDGTVITQAGTPVIVNSFTSYRHGWMLYTMPRNYQAMMQGNIFMRMHQMWYVLHRVNADILSGAMSAFFQNNRQFVLRDANRNDLIYDRGTMTAPAGARVINKSANMVVPNICRNTVRGTFTEAQEQHVAIPGAPGRQVCLGLYDVGHDRSSHERFHTGQTDPYQGVLVVRLLMQVTFEDGVNHAFWRTHGTAAGGGNLATTLQKIQNAWNRRSGWYSLSPGTRGMRRIFVHFVPGLSTAASPQSNMNALFLRTNTPAGQQPIVLSGGQVRFRFDFTEANLIRFLFNSAAAAAVGTNAAEHASWDFIRTWTASHIGENPASFQMQNL